jgi:hypothetical protein
MSDKDMADELVKVVENNLTKWKVWFPNKSSGVEVPRDQLLALIADRQRLADLADELQSDVRRLENSRDGDCF